MSRPAGHTAVMADRQPTDAGERDYFPTPPWAARAGGELIRRIDPIARSCWEPAAGEGHMAHGLGDYFDQVVASDIHDYGDPFGVFADLAPCGIGDFLDVAGVGPSADWIVTNPPFVAGEAFVRTALRRATRGVAMLLRSVFLEGAARSRLFTDPTLGFAVAAQFAERVPMVKGRWDPEASTATAYSWFVWLKPEVGLAAGPIQLAIREAQHAGGHLGLIIPPATRARLSRDADLYRFSRTTPEPGEFV